MPVAAARSCWFLIDVGQRGSRHNGSLQIPDGTIGCVPLVIDPGNDDTLFGRKGFVPLDPAAKAKAKCGDKVGEEFAEC